MESYASFLTESSNKNKKSWGQNWGTWSVKGLPYKHNKLNWNPRAHTKSTHHGGWNLLGRQNSADLWIRWPRSLTWQGPCQGETLSQAGWKPPEGWHLRLSSGLLIDTHMHECAPVSPYISPTHEHVHTLISTKMSDMGDISQGFIPKSFHSILMYYPSI